MVRFTLLRATVLALWSISLLVWLLIAVRAITYDNCWCDPIIDGNPVPDYMTAALSFVVSFVFLVAYLRYWGFPNMPGPSK
jgi:hypothetical protein